MITKLPIKTINCPAPWHRVSTQNGLLPAGDLKSGIKVFTVHKSANYTDPKLFPILNSLDINFQPIYPWISCEINYVEIIPNAERVIIEFDCCEGYWCHDNPNKGTVKMPPFICTPTHKFHINGQWTEVLKLKPGDVCIGPESLKIKSINSYKNGDVVNIVIDDANTYFCEGLWSHSGI